MSRSSSRLALFATFPVLVLAACGGGEEPADPPAPSSSSSSGESSSSSSSSSGEPSSSSSSSSSSSGTIPQPITCTDGIKNGDEGDVDCGYACDQKCAAGQACNGKPDCKDGICTAGLCAAPTDSDGVKNGTETDIDCGGESERKCISPKRCLLDGDCASDQCSVDGICFASYHDGAKNQDESDIDCGGAAPLRCAADRVCRLHTDCADQGACLAGVCKAPTHGDDRLNLDETDIDCGGPLSPNKCGVGDRCLGDGDCSTSTYCGLTGTCAPLGNSGTDNVTSGSETDRDCGGPSARPCVTGYGCAVASDCESKKCEAGATSAAGNSPALRPEVGNRRCVAPTSTDGLLNGTESDVDCGGAGNPKCGVEKDCREHSDCQSDGCHKTKKTCVQRRSCAMTYGGDTCGGPAGAEIGGDSCCAAIQVQRPTKLPALLGKYKITAGRVRQMVERENGNVRGYIDSLGLPAVRWNPAWSTWLPRNLNEVVDRLGPNQMGDEVAPTGCQVSVNGGRPYWFNAFDGVGAGAVPAAEAGKYSHDILDQKVINCIMPALAAAFCIWDGGDLADPDDIRFAWNGTATAAGVVTDTRKYPWGDAPALPTSTGGKEQACVDSNCNSYVVHRNNYNYPMYEKPDNTLLIPAPGRRPAGAGPFGHMDLAGAGFEQTKQRLAAVLGTFNNGSFEGHIPAAYGKMYANSAALNRRYWGFAAGRCSYPVP